MSASASRHAFLGAPLALGRPRTTRRLGLALAMAGAIVLGGVQLAATSEREAAQLLAATTRDPAYWSVLVAAFALHHGRADRMR